MPGEDFDFDDEAQIERKDENVTRRLEGAPGNDEQDQQQGMVTRLASEFHEDWRKTRLNPDTGVYEPRIKPTKDEAWIRAHGTDQVDIANTTYENLPDDWQAENRAAAEVVMSGISEAAKTGQNLSDTQTVEGLADRVHQAWLERNGAWAPAEQKLSYVQLAEPEKAKDRDQVLKGVQVFRNPTPPPAAQSQK